MENDNSKTVKRTEVEVEQDTITVRTDLDVPSKYPALPIFAGQGWIYADVVKEKEMSKQYRIEDDETGAALKFTPSWNRSDVLPKGHHHHDRKAKHVFEVGDFLVDFQFTYEGNPRLRVRIHPDITDPDPKVVVESLSDEDEAGR